jgi:hypothetical protein
MSGDMPEEERGELADVCCVNSTRNRTAFTCVKWPIKASVQCSSRKRVQQTWDTVSGHAIDLALEHSSAIGILDDNDGSKGRKQPLAFRATYVYPLDRVKSEGLESHLSVPSKQQDINAQVASS